MEAVPHGCECTNWSQSWKMLAFYLVGVRLCPYFCRWGQRQISSAGCKFNFTQFFTRQQISSTIWKSDSISLYSRRLLFGKVINDLQMFGLPMNKSGLAKPEGRVCWQAVRLSPAKIAAITNFSFECQNMDHQQSNSAEITLMTTYEALQAPSPD